MKEDPKKETICHSPNPSLMINSECCFRSFRSLVCVITLLFYASSSTYHYDDKKMQEKNTTHSNTRGNRLQNPLVSGYIVIQCLKI
jgi:hypothetical protein